jgi:D-alanyl-D-alanine carboxypeptidase
MRASERSARIQVADDVWRRLAIGVILSFAAVLAVGAVTRPPFPGAPSAAPVSEAVAEAPTTPVRSAAATAASVLPARNAGIPRLVDLHEDDAPAGQQGGVAQAAPVEAAPPTAVPAPATIVSPAPVADPATAATYQTALEHARIAFGAPGVSYAVVVGGELRWTGTSGNPGGVPAADGQPSLVVGSVAKTFMAATVLRLGEEGRFALDDPVTDYLPEAQLARGVTIRQLLSHTSGIADLFTSEVEAAIDSEPSRAWTTAEVLSTIGDAWFEPGAAWAYSNTNYLLLGLLIERVTGTTLADEINRRFATPLGLTHTAIVGSDGVPGMLNRALATTFWGSGAMVSTSADLARWGDLLYSGDLLWPDTRAAMMRVNDDDYGLGTQRLELEEDFYAYGHSGLLGWYTTILAHLPEQDVTIAIIANRGRADLNGMLSHRADGRASLLDLALGRTPPPPTPRPSPSP